MGLVRPFVLRFVMLRVHVKFQKAAKIVALRSEEEQGCDELHRAVTQPHWMSPPRRHPARCRAAFGRRCAGTCVRYCIPTRASQRRRMKGHGQGKSAHTEDSGLLREGRPRYNCNSCFSDAATGREQVQRQRTFSLPITRR